MIEFFIKNRFQIGSGIHSLSLLLKKCLVCKVR